MLDQSLLDALRGYMEKLERPVGLRLHPGDHDKRIEIVSMLESVANLSDKISVEHGTVEGSLQSPLTFELLANDAHQGVVFSGIPGGHEFNSFVLALLHTGGVPIKLDQSVQALIRQIKVPLHFQTVVSLSCHSCPDVVQTLNQFAFINPLISHEMIDGGLFPDFIEQYQVQGVPSVLVNNKAFLNGKVDSSQIVSKLQDFIKSTEPSQDDPSNSNQTPTFDITQIQDVIVLGGGPAGVGAAIYTARKGLKVTLIAERFGGQVKDTMGIENLISVPHTTGPKLTNYMREHLNQYSVTLKEHFKVEKLVKLSDYDESLQPVDFTGPVHLIFMSSGEVLATKSLIIATGARWRELGVPGERENIGQGVAYCPHCDGPFFKGKKVAVVGGGNSGVEAALDLAGIVEHVTVLEFMPELKADQILIDQMAKRTNISVIKNVETKQVIAENNKVVALEYEHRDSKKIDSVILSGIFVQIGLLPNTDFVGDYAARNRFGEIEIDQRCATNTTGVFAAGDVTTVPFKQIVIAMGEGSKAGLSAFEYLLKQL